MQGRAEAYTPYTNYRGPNKYTQVPMKKRENPRNKKIKNRNIEKERKKILVLCSVPNHQLGTLGTVRAPQGSGVPRALGTLRLRGLQGSGAPCSGVPKTQGSPMISVLKTLRHPRLGGHQGLGAPKARGLQVLRASQS
jgi:hypothetical protein